MSGPFDLGPRAGGGPHPSVAPRWRAAAADLRRLAAEVTRPATDLAAFHRPDVWQGAVPTRFGDDLDRWRHLIGQDLSGDDLSVASELVAMAGRLEARAVAAEIAAGGGDGAFWGRRDPP